jgi:hypothetical protein
MNRLRDLRKLISIFVPGGIGKLVLTKSEYKRPGKVEQ